MWTPLSNSPAVGVSTMVLLTDGRLLCRGDDGTTAGGRRWLLLTASSTGSYVDGNWAEAATSANARRFYASAVLADGRVFVAGGEDSDGGSDLNAAESYDPVANTWSRLPTPGGWTAIGDAPCCVLPDGRLLLGSILTTETAIYDPKTNRWKAADNKDDRSDEETWTLLPDGTVLAVECSNHPKAEKYLPSDNRWTSAGTLPVELVQTSSSEIGPAILLPDGRVFALGATGHTAFYSRPSAIQAAGTWTQGSDLPRDPNGVQLIAKDAPAALLPNGNVLCVASPLAEGSGSKSYPGPSYFFEFDGRNFNPLPSPRAGSSPAFAFRFLLLPTGQVIVSSGSSDIDIYDSAGSADPRWAPQVKSCPNVVAISGTHQLTGTQLNGLSQAVSYGDDATMATNYPIVRLRRTEDNSVLYCRTHGHQTMGVATGSQLVTTNFDVPTSARLGAATLEVVANGIASPGIPVTVQPPVPNVNPKPRTGCILNAALIVSAVSIVTFLVSLLLNDSL